MKRTYIFPCPYCDGMLETDTNGTYLRAITKHKGGRIAPSRSTPNKHKASSTKKHTILKSVTCLR